MSFALGADYRISESWVSGALFKKYGNLNYGNPLLGGDSTKVLGGESAYMFDLYLNKEKPLHNTRVFVGPRLSLIRWQSR